MMHIKKIRLLIIDDSALVRDILCKGLSQDPGIEIVGTAADVYIARDLIVQLQPDVLTLDIEMPKMDGIAFLERLMPQHPLPVVVVSSLTQRGKEITLQALSAGAVDFVPKPTTNMVQGLQGMLLELRAKIKIASIANVGYHKNKPSPILGPKPKIKSSQALAESTDKIITIGASTGGTEAIRKIITALPRAMPGIVVVQHMPPGFTKTFANRLNEESLLTVKEAEHGDRVMPGMALIAPGDFHLTIERSGGRYEVRCNSDEKVNGHRPSVDILFYSAARFAAKNACGIILTGMGNDGAMGLKQMRDAGAYTIGQDEHTCTVYGMPKTAFDAGAVEVVSPLDRIAHLLIQRHT